MSSASELGRSHRVDDVQCVAENEDEAQRLRALLAPCFPSAGLEEEEEDSVPTLTVSAREEWVKSWTAIRCSMDLVAVFAALETHTLGRNLLYSERVSSTQTLLEKRMPLLLEPIVFACHTQVAGKGRGKNVWESPPGCLCFSFRTSTKNVARLPFFQYLVSLVMVRVVKAMHDQVDIRLKWPNDIYAGSQLKLGGVLCQSTCMGGEFHVTVGLGINVTNSEPTTCLQDMLRKVGFPTLVSREAVLAAYLNEFERCLAVFEVAGFEPFQDEYLEHWLHTGQEVTLEAQDALDSQCKAIVQGLTPSGFLHAKDVESGESYELHPDGNSFDFFKGLVVAKRM